MKISRAKPLHQYNLHEFRLGLLDRLFVKRRQERSNFHRQMFDEDFARIFNGTNSQSGRSFNITSNDEELTMRLLLGFRTGFRPDSIDKTVLEWAQEIAESIVRLEVAYYWLAHSSENEGIHIASFDPSGVTHLCGGYFQWLPKRTERRWGEEDEEVPREIRILDSAKVMGFVLPNPMKRILSAQNRTLSYLDKHQFRVTDFQTQATHENPNPTNHFDFSAWQDTQELALYRSTRVTGWNGRKYNSAKRSDFFDCYRLIRFRRNQVKLRDGILKQLSSELSRVGKSYNAEYAVEILATNELPSVADLNELEARLSREEVGFTEIMDHCLKR